MNDEQMQALLEEEFRALDATPRDVERSTRRVMERKAHIRQRGRWWPIPVSYRRSETPRRDTIEHQPRPYTETNGHTPTVIGRTQLMFSPAKAIAVGALVFAVGGVMLIAQPIERQGNVPGAANEPVAPTWVTGDVRPAISCSDGDVEIDAHVRRSRNVECSPQTWTSSDPRLTGEVVRRWNDDIYQTDEGTISVSADAAYLRNDDGGWACSDSRLLKGSDLNSEAVTGGTFTCVGEGGYAGLSAILVLEEAGGYSEEIVGLIFAGDFPPLPEPPAAE